MAHLWSGRFAGDPDAELFAFGSSFRFDRRLFEDDVRGSRAWAAGLARAGVLSAVDAAAIEQDAAWLEHGAARQDGANEEHAGTSGLDGAAARRQAGGQRGAAGDRWVVVARRVSRVAGIVRVSGITPRFIRARLAGTEFRLMKRKSTGTQLIGKSAMPSSSIPT